MPRCVVTAVIVILSFISGRAGDWHPWPGNDRLPTAEVYSVYIDSGRLYIGTDRGLYCSDIIKGKPEPIALKNRFGKTGVTVRYIGKAKAVSLEDVYQLNGGESKIVRNAGEADLYKREFTDATGVKWKFDTRKPSLIRIDGTDTIAIPEALAGKIVTDISQAGKFRIAVATNNDGIYILDLHGKGIDNIRRTSNGAAGLPRNHVMGLCYDETTGSLYAAIPQAGVWTAEMGLIGSQEYRTGIDEDVSSIVRDGNGLMWLSYDGGGIQMLDRQFNQIKHFTQNSTGIPSDVITSLYPIDASHMLASTYGKGVFKIDRQGNWEISGGLDENSPAAQCRSIAKDRFGNIWVATFTRGVVRASRSGGLHMFTTSNSALLTNYITDLKISARGDSVFVATGFGLYAFDAASLESCALNPPEGEPLKIRQMASDYKGRLMLGTDKGVYGRSGNLIALEGVPVKAICADLKSGVWCASDSTLYYIDGDESSRQIAVPAGAGFANYALTAGTGGEVYAGGFGAVVIADSDLLHQPSQDAPPFSHILAAAAIMLAVVLSLYFIIRRRPGHPAAAVAEPAVSEKDGEPKIDTEWLDKVSSIIQANLADAGFGVEQLSRAMAMSRSNLYKKLLALTGMTPQEYIRTARIEAGRRIIEENRGSQIRLTMGEVAYRVGMSPRQFSKYFRSGPKE